ncbi:MAG: tRNA lysidine(34) synthetase TilS, partial [Campylobacterales bacterium]|nr:tRNA lysidine(34) synthetase TilS [Campylobacterales bacterium]
MLKQNLLPHLQDKKNLLAFSAGGDSTALFFLLLDANIDFDIAIVDYGVREQSKDEVAYAKELCIRYNKTCHHHEAKEIEKNFEASARAIRYDFFHKIIDEFGYKNLLTAHHLGDRF